MAPLAGECVVEALKLIEKGKQKFQPQDPEEATLAPKIDRDDALIDWRNEAHIIYNQIRALQPWPVAETFLGSQRLKIFQATIENTESDIPTGHILTDGKSFLSVKCADSKALSLTEIQLENRKKLNVRDFLTAFRGSFTHQKMGTL
jgi:methionyl-tRNA formyltransferase